MSNISATNLQIQHLFFKVMESMGSAPPPSYGEISTHALEISNGVLKERQKLLDTFFFRHTVFVLNNVFFGINIINIFLSILGADDIGLSGPFSLRVNRK